ncbi:hypothetical protein P4E94_19305 [Pontiellaceae bacterium B12219]|nr:hypothetical protein [Pontiellaceae bacterium B12219]
MYLPMLIIMLLAMIHAIESQQKKKAGVLLDRTVRTIDRLEKKPFDLFAVRTETARLTSNALLDHVETNIKFAEQSKGISNSEKTKRIRLFNNRYNDLEKRIIHLERITRNIEAAGSLS